MYQHDDPRTYEEWRASALRRQQKWIHMQTVRGNLDMFKGSNRNHAGALSKLLAPLPHPDAMDTSADRARGRLAGAEDVLNTPQPPFQPRGGYLQRQRENRGVRDFSQIRCYNCNKMGHISRDCRQPKQGRRPQQIRSTEQKPQTDEDKAEDWLRGVASEGDDVKDLILQKLMGTDFSDA